MLKFYNAKKPTDVLSLKPRKAYVPDPMFDHVEIKEYKVKNLDDIVISNFKVTSVKKIDYAPGIRVKCKKACPNCVFNKFTYMSLPVDLVPLTMKIPGYLSKVAKDHITAMVKCDKPYFEYDFIKQRSATLMEIGTDTPGVKYYVVMFKKYSLPELKKKYLNKSFYAKFKYYASDNKAICFSREDLLTERYKLTPDVYVKELVEHIKKYPKLLKYMINTYRYTRRDIQAITGNRSETDTILTKLKELGLLRQASGLMFRTRKLMFILIVLAQLLLVTTKSIISSLSAEILAIIKNLKYYKFFLPT